MNAEWFVLYRNGFAYATRDKSEPLIQMTKENPDFTAPQNGAMPTWELVRYIPQATVAASSQRLPSRAGTMSRPPVTGHELYLLASRLGSVDAELVKSAADELMGSRLALHAKRRLTRELDVALNGEQGAAQQASLCDIVSQVKDQRWKLVRAE